MTVVDYLHDRNPNTHIVILGILPRGSDPEDMTRLPSEYSRAIAAVNGRLERYAFGNRQLHFADCGPAFIQTGKVRVPFYILTNDLCSKQLLLVVHLY